MAVDGAETHIQEKLLLKCLSAGRSGQHRVPVIESIPVRAPKFLKGLCYGSLTSDGRGTPLLHVNLTSAVCASEHRFGAMIFR